MNTIAKITIPIIVGTLLMFSGAAKQPADEPATYDNDITTISATKCVNPSEPEHKWTITQEDIELIALVTMAEAEGECEYGKRMVIDTILNRLDSDRFPNTVHDVIYSPNQFSCMWNGRVDRCYVRDDICDLVVDELMNRTNWETVYFTAGRYSSYGTPLFQIEHHYFSGF